MPISKKSAILPLRKSCPRQLVRNEATLFQVVKFGQASIAVAQSNDTLELRSSSSADDR